MTSPRTQRRWSALLMFAFLVVPTAVLGNDSSAKNEWHVRHKLTNQRHEEGTPLVLRVANGSIQAFDHKKQVLNVAASQVLAISVDDAVHRPVNEWLKATLSVTSREMIRQARAQPTTHDPLGLKGLIGMSCAGMGTVSCEYKDNHFMATMVGDVVVAAFASLVDSRLHYRCFDVIWMEDGVLRNALFHVSDQKEERPLLDALSLVSGKPWVDLVERRRQMRKEFEGYKAHAHPLVLDRAVLLQGELLPAGAYRLVSLPRDNGLELDFFRGDTVSPETFVAQAPALAKPRDKTDGAAAAMVRYTLEGPTAGIAEITTSDSVFTLGPAPTAAVEPAVAPATAAPVAEITTAPAKPAPTASPIEPASPAASPALPTPPATSANVAAAAPAVSPAPTDAAASPEKPDLPVLTLSLKDGRTAQVTLVNYRGHRAFRFPVEHFHTKFGLTAKGPEECPGSLYVMADRIAFDAGLNLHKDRDPFDLARSEVSELNIIPRSATNWGSMRVVTGQKQYDFLPYFTNTQSPIAKLPPPGSGVAGALGLASGFKQLWSVGTAGRPMLDAFMDAALDFQGTLAAVESGKYTPNPHKHIPQPHKESEGAGETPSDEATPQ